MPRKGSGREGELAEGGFRRKHYVLSLSRKRPEKKNCQDSVRKKILSVPIGKTKPRRNVLLTGGGRGKGGVKKERARFYAWGRNTHSAKKKHRVCGTTKARWSFIVHVERPGKKENETPRKRKKERVGGRAKKGGDNLSAYPRVFFPPRPAVQKRRKGKERSYDGVMPLALASNTLPGAVTQ